MRLTLDTNCLIDLEKGTRQADAIRELINLHRAGNVQVFVSALSVSEDLTGKGVSEDFSELEARLKKCGLDDLPSIAGRNEMSLWGAAVYGAENDDLRDKIKSIIHSTVDTLTLTRNARNVVCDVAGLAAHIRSGHDIFVTTDQHFRKGTRRERLLALGARDILTPQEALSKVLHGAGRTEV